MSQAAAEGDVVARSAADSPLRRALLTVAASRLIVFAAGFIAAAAVGIHSVNWGRRYPAGAEPFHGNLGSLFNPWAHWDGTWFIKIADGGYGKADGTAAFFPLYPLLLRGVGFIFGNNFVIAGIVLSLACFLAALAVLYRLVADAFGDRVAWLTTLYLSFFPTAFYFQAVYSESLFLLLVLLCFYWSQKKAWLLAGIAGLLATLTRSAGLLLIVPMAIMYYQDIGWKWRRTDARALSLLLVPEGLMIWMAFLALEFGRPFLFLQAQDQWHRDLATPNYTLLRGFKSATQGFRQLISGQTDRLYWPVEGGGSAFDLAVVNITAFLFTAVAIILLWHGARRLPFAYTAWGALAVGFPLLFPNKYQPLYSMPRLVLVVFPIFIALALFTEHRPKAHRVVMALEVVGLIALTMRFAVFDWVA